MQLPLSFAQDPSSQIEPAPNVWSLLSSEQRVETIAVLARLVAKAATPDPTIDPSPPHEEKRDD
jgi:hypothetical protein